MYRVSFLDFNGTPCLSQPFDFMSIAILHQFRLISAGASRCRVMQFPTA